MGELKPKGSELRAMRLGFGQPEWLGGDKKGEKKQ